jgi:DNA-binding NarL/FixJ family response regulator
MAEISCLAGIDRSMLPMLTAALKASGETRRPVRSALNVRDIGRVHPELLVADIDGLAVDPLELIRQIRFVLPTCVIVVVSAERRREWALACHLAGVNGVVSKSSTKAEVVEGLADARASGCYTDPRFVA